jgi:hypothetical protein
MGREAVGDPVGGVTGESAGAGCDRRPYDAPGARWPEAAARDPTVPAGIGEKAVNRESVLTYVNENHPVGALESLESRP